MFFQWRKSVCGVTHKANPDLQWKVRADEMVRMLRLKHRSLSTEKTYLSWLRSFYQFIKGKSPDDLAGSDVKDFLTYLAAERKVAHSTHVAGKNLMGVKSPLDQL